MPQEFRCDSVMPCSEQSHLAVTEVASLFPERPVLEPAWLTAAARCQPPTGCSMTAKRHRPPHPEPGTSMDFQLLTQQAVQGTCDITKAATWLVTTTT